MKVLILTEHMSIYQLTFEYICMVALIIPWYVCLKAVKAILVGCITHNMHVVDVDVVQLT